MNNYALLKIYDGDLLKIKKYLAVFLHIAKNPEINILSLGKYLLSEGGKKESKGTQINVKLNKIIIWFKYVLRRRFIFDAEQLQIN